MAAACYERKVGEFLTACGKPPALIRDYSDLQLSRETVLGVVATAAAPTASTPALASLSPVGLPAGAAGVGSVPSTTILPAPAPMYKDYSQPLHVDCSVEYELPSQAKPPPGGGEPLLMIHPCYYRRAERQKRTLFVNNLPPRSSSSSTSSSSSRRSSSSKSKSLASVPGLTGMVVNPVMPVATAAVAASAHHQSSVMSATAPVHLGNGANMLPSPSLASIVAAGDVHNAPAAVAAAAAATYHAALTAALGAHQTEAKLQPQPQQHPSSLQATTELDEKVLSAAGLYPQYFRSVQRQQQQQQPAAQVSTQQQTQNQLHHRLGHSHQHHQTHHSHQHQQPSVASASATILHQAYPSQQQQQQQQQQIQSSQPTSYGMAMMAAPAPLQRHHHQQTVIGSTATPTILPHHPYRRTSGSIASQPRLNVKQCSSSASLSASSTTSSASSSASSASSLTSSALPTGSASSYNMSNVYASTIHRHHHHHAIHALQATHGAFYEAPVYHALLPQS